jgi:hypothetical protein
MKGVPKSEAEEYGKSDENCWRYGDSGHKTYACFRHHTIKGTKLPLAPWKVSATRPTKHARDDDDNEKNLPTAKTQKVAAVDPMEVEQPAAPPFPWEDSESDF